MVGRRALLGMEQVDGEVVALVGDGHDADERARPAPGGAAFAARQGIKEGGLARLGQADQTDFQGIILLGRGVLARRLFGEYTPQENRG